MLRVPQKWKADSSGWITKKLKVEGGEVESGKMDSVKAERGGTWRHKEIMNYDSNKP